MKKREKIKQNIGLPTELLLTLFQKEIFDRDLASLSRS